MRKKLKDSPVVVLRKAATAWAAGLTMPMVGSRDLAFAKLDRRLQRAAVAFARSQP